MRTLGVVLLLLTQVPFARAGRVEIARYPNGAIESVRVFRGAHKAGTHTAWWPNGHLRSVAQYGDDAFDGVYATWYESGQPYERRHFVNGRESGMQQSWTSDGTLYLNYEVRDGRRYGLVNARPCVPTLPFYETADFTPKWAESPDRSLTFELTSQRGERVTGADVIGRPHVAAFLFTRCTTVCPSLLAQLKRVQAASRVTIVTYSVTPDLDTPEVLKAFGARVGADPERWLMLTGSREVIYRLARGFYFADDSRLSSAAGEFLHTEKVLLVDGRGRLRGVYDGTQPFDIDRLIADAAALAP